MVFDQSVWENMSGVKCLITTGPHSISVMPLFITKNHVYWRHIYYLHEGCLCSMKSYVAKVGNKEVWYGYRPPVSPASLSFPSYQSISVALHKTYLHRSVYLPFPSASAGREDFSSERTVELSSTWHRLALSYHGELELQQMKQQSCRVFTKH